MIRALWGALAVALAIGCAGNDQPGPMPASAGVAHGRMAAAPYAGKAQFAQESVADPRMIIRTGSIEVVVVTPEEAARALTAEVEQLGGFVSSSTESEDRVHIRARVPSSQLEAFLDSAAALGEEENRSLTGQDVTDAYSDLKAEIDNLVSLRDRLRVLLDKARTVKEVLEVERELTRVQTRLDSLESRRQRMAKDVAMSAVDVHLNKEPERRILGPVGLLYAGVKWVAIKLWVISP